jgi:YVTN family beta-propeller protein
MSNRLRRCQSITTSGLLGINDTERMKAIKSINVGSGASYLAVTPNGRRVYVASQGSDDVFVIDTETNKVVATINVGQGPIGVAFTPNGKYASM